MMPPNRLFGLAVATLVSIAHWLAQSQEAYPNRPIKVVVPFPPGGATDILTRDLLAAQAHAHLLASVADIPILWPVARLNSDIEAARVAENPLQSCRLFGVRH